MLFRTDVPYTTKCFADSGKTMTVYFNAMETAEGKRIYLFNGCDNFNNSEACKKCLADLAEKAYRGELAEMLADPAERILNCSDIPV